MNDRLFIGILIGAIIAWLFLRNSSSEAGGCSCMGGAGGAGGFGAPGSADNGSTCYLRTNALPASTLGITFPAASPAVVSAN